MIPIAGYDQGVAPSTPDAGQRQGVCPFAGRSARAVAA